MLRKFTTAAVGAVIAIAAVVGLSTNAAEASGPFSQKYVEVQSMSYPLPPNQHGPNGEDTAIDAVIDGATATLLFKAATEQQKIDDAEGYVNGGVDMTCGPHDPGDFPLLDGPTDVQSIDPPQ